MEVRKEEGRSGRTAWAKARRQWETNEGSQAGRNVGSFPDFLWWEMDDKGARVDIRGPVRATVVRVRDDCGLHCGK